MGIKDVDWDDNNINHISIHSITPDEVEDVAFDDNPWIRKGKMGTRYVLGYTVGGRYLFVVYTLKSNDIARVITAMDMDDKTRKLYKKKVKWLEMGLPDFKTEKDVGWKKISFLRFYSNCGSSPL